MVPSPDYSNNGTLQVYKKLITQTIMLFSGITEIEATKISQNILDFELNLTKVTLLFYLDMGVTVWDRAVINTLYLKRSMINLKCVVVFAF